MKMAIIFIVLCTFSFIGMIILLGISFTSTSAHKDGNLIFYGFIFVSIQAVLFIIPSVIYVNKYRNKKS